jgi:succinyl-CoA:acetate CoA-transferase
MSTITSPTSTRVLNSELAQKIMSADEAASLIKSGDQVGMSGFTGSGDADGSECRYGQLPRPHRSATAGNFQSS